MLPLQSNYPVTADIVILAIIAAVIPSLFFIGLIYWVDRYEKEPLWLLAAAFLWGAIPSIIFAFIVNTVSSLVPYFLLGPGLGDAIGATFIAPPVEESIKGIALLGILFLWRHEIDSLLDGIIYGAMVGLGFAMIENIYYFLNVYAADGGEALGFNIFLRAFVFGLNHSLFTSMIGLGIAIARLSRNTLVRWTAPVGGWFMAMLLHAVHNGSASAAAAIGPAACLVTFANAWGGLLITLLIIIWALWQERKWIKQYLAEEVALGTLTNEQYDRASSWQRIQHQYQLLFSKGPMGYINANRFYHKCSELAYKKHHFSILQEAKSDELTNKLRGEISRLGDLI